MSDSLTWIHIALAATNVLAISAASINAALTFIVIPRFLELPAPLNARRWHSMFNVTKYWVAGPMMVSGFGYLGLAYALRDQLLVAAALLCFSIVPYTAQVVMPSIDKLFAKLEVFRDIPDLSTAKEESKKGETAHDLIQEWGTWNLGRAIPVVIAGLIGQYTMYHI